MAFKWLIEKLLEKDFEKNNNDTMLIFTRTKPELGMLEVVNIGKKDIAFSIIKNGTTESYNIISKELYECIEDKILDYIL